MLLNTEHYLILLLALLFGLLVFFSVAETSMLSLNRYRLRHLARQKNRGAKRSQKLLSRPDRLLGVILMGSTFCNVAASAVATVIAENLFGVMGVAIATGLLTLAILIFTEITPKTLAALYPERCAFVLTLPLVILLKLFYPLVWFVSTIANGFLRVFGIRVDTLREEHLTADELRTVVLETAGKIPAGHQEMVLRILDLEKVTVEDVMIPRNEVIGIDLKESWENILTQIRETPYSHLPVYDEDINHLHGILNLRKILRLLTENRTLDKEMILAETQESYFIPEGTSLNTQLLNFRRKKAKVGLVVDEYGEILGMVSIEDVLEEIVGDLTVNRGTVHEDVHLESDGSYLVNGSINIRELNRVMDWHFNIEGPKTLSGLIIEYLEAIPMPGICLRLSGYPIEVLEVMDNTVKKVRIKPKFILIPAEK
jgi:Mg2+/Co2+ transporter CorB